MKGHEKSEIFRRISDTEIAAAKIASIFVSNSVSEFASEKAMT